MGYKSRYNFATSLKKCVNPKVCICRDCKKKRELKKTSLLNQLLVKLRKYK